MSVSDERVGEIAGLDAPSQMTPENVATVADRLRVLADGIEAAGTGYSLRPLIAPLLHQGEREPGQLATWYTASVRDDASPELRHCLRQTLEGLGRLYARCTSSGRINASSHESDEQIVNRLRAAADLLVRMLVIESPKRGAGRPPTDWTLPENQRKRMLFDMWEKAKEHLKENKLKVTKKAGAALIGEWLGEQVSEYELGKAIEAVRPH